MSRRPSVVRTAPATDQPSLPLVVTATPPRMAIEASTPCAAAFDSDDWIFTVDWEGSRALLVTDGDGGARIQGTVGSLEARFPEVAAAAARLGPTPLVLDGSVCVLDALGRPMLEALAERAASGARRPRAVFLATDVLRHGATDLRRRPLAERLDLLATIVGTDPTIQAPEHVNGNGSALAEAASERGLVAMLARRRHAPYHAGVASPDRLRVALTGRREYVVAGAGRRGDHLHAVLALWDHERLERVAAVPVEARTWRRLLESAPTAARAPAGGAASPAGGPRWLAPQLVATVDPALTAPDGSVRRWRLVAVRDDVDPRWCAARHAVAPPTAATHGPRAFNPTVLSALPLDGAA